MAPNYQEFQQLDDSSTKHDQIIQISRLKALFPILFQTCSVKIFQKLWTWSLWSWLLLKTSSSEPRSLAEEHSDELKKLGVGRCGGKVPLVRRNNWRCMAPNKWWYREGNTQGKSGGNAPNNDDINNVDAIFGSIESDKFLMTSAHHGIACQ